MILNIPPQTEHIIHQIAQQQGMSIEQFMIHSAYEKALHLAYQHNPIKSENTSISNFIKNKKLESFQGDPVAIQKALRDE